MSLPLWLALLVVTPSHAHPAPRRLRDAAAGRGLACELEGAVLECVPEGSGPDTPPARVDLGPQLARWDRAAPTGREALLQTWLEGLPPPADWAVPDSFAEAAPRLRLQVRARVDSQLRSEPAAALPLGDHLVAELSLEGEASRRWVPVAWLEHWKVGLAEAALQAARNQGAPLVPPTPASSGQAALAVAAGRELADVADLLPTLFLDPWQQGAVLALARSSTELLLCPVAETECVLALLEAAEAAPSSGRPLSHQPLIWREGAWHSWTPSPTTPGAGRWDAVIAHEQSIMDEHSAAGLDPAGGFHGTLSPVLRAGRTGTLATWVPSSATVPVGDWLALSNAEESAYIIVPWQAAAPLLTEHLRPLDGHYPPRMRVVHPVDPALFAALSAHAPDGVRPMR